MHVHIMGTLGHVTIETLLAAMETLVHAHTMCTRPFLLLNSKGLGVKVQKCMYLYLL